MPYPIGVGQVDAYGCGRIAVSAQHAGRYDFCRHSFYLFFFEPGIHGRVVFEPLGVFAYRPCASGGFLVAEIHYAFPAGFYAEGVPVCFDEAVQEVDFRQCVVYPQDAVLVECRRISILVKIDKRVDYLFLFVVFGINRGFFQMGNNPVDDFAVFPA